jgi:hypothetical protein
MRLSAQLNCRQWVTAILTFVSGGHGTRTHNRLPGTTFPVWPLAIRLPSGNRTCVNEKRRRTAVQTAFAGELSRSAGSA